MDYSISNLITLGLNVDRIEFVQMAQGRLASGAEITSEDARQCVQIVLDLLAAREEERGQHRAILNRLRSVDQSLRGFSRTITEALDVAEGRTPVLPGDER